MESDVGHGPTYSIRSWYPVASTKVGFASLA